MSCTFSYFFIQNLPFGCIENRFLLTRKNNRKRIYFFFKDCKPIKFVRCLRIFSIRKKCCKNPFSHCFWIKIYCLKNSKKSFCSKNSKKIFLKNQYILLKKYKKIFGQGEIFFSKKLG